MKNFHTEKKLKKYTVILPLTVVSLSLLLSIVCYFFLNQGTAWFANNNEATGENMSVNLEGPGFENVKISLHNVIGNSESDGTETIYFTTAEGDGTLPKYDILDRVNRHVLMRIEFPESEEITLSAAADAASYFMNGQNGHDPLRKTDNFISNIICFASVTPVVNNDYTPSGEAETNSAYAVTLPGTDRYVDFVDSTNGSISLNHSPITLFDGAPAGEGEAFCVYILISYSDENLSLLYSENIGNENLSGDPADGGADTIEYKMDFVFRLEKKGA